MDNTVYDVIIVGAGMIGSAAARYASERKDFKVCVIGPEEPKMKRSECSRDIYGAHYDEARITNSTQADHPIWAKLAARSMEAYRNLEKQSGIDFYTESGSVWIGIAGGKIISTGYKGALDSGHVASVLNAQQSMQKFPYMKIYEDEEVLYQQKAGYVNPRKLVLAELAVAQKNNCDIIRDIVSAIDYAESRPIRLVTDMGNELYAHKVLLAPGAFIESRQLLPAGFSPEMQLFGTSVIYAEVSDDDLKRMRNMPSITKVIETAYYRGCYILPPVKYPDGKYYIKLGHGVSHGTTLLSPQIKDWYRQRVSPRLQKQLQKLLYDIFPDFTPVSISTDTCVTTRTKDTSLYVDLLTPRVGVAIAGNGYAAKACDHIGKIAADLIITSQWNSDLPRSWFKFRNSVSKL